tara:strand:+ start:221 stop:1675 length:1455 start_codon:yes stop_codon:yes gene_type:complete
MKIQFENITKTFGSVVANDLVSFQIESGTIHAIIGENGAGKSTLVKILAGLITPDSGEMYVNDKIVELGSVSESQAVGIGILGQDPWDFANLTVIESFMVGSKHNTPFMDYQKLRRTVGDYCKNYGLRINVDTHVKNLSIGERQQIELFRLLFNGAQVIILDEPTSAFSLDQKKLVFDTLKGLAANGYSIVLVSHKIDEVLEICARATVMRGGKVVDTLNLPVPYSKLIDLMFGVNNDSSFNKNRNMPSNRFLNISSIARGDKRHNGFKDVPEGCILGIAGLQGSGADGFVKSIFDTDAYKISITRETEKKDFLDNRRNVTYLPADRLEKGLFSDLSVLEHFALAKSHGNSLIDWSQVKNEALSLVQEFGIKGETDSKASHLSGGNQQRLMLSLIDKDTEILLMEQPTRGLDVLSAKFVWDKLVESKKDKVLTVFSSHDIDEICMYSDYIICFHGDDISGYGSNLELSRLEVMNLISGRFQDDS